MLDGTLLEKEQRKRRLEGRHLLHATFAQTSTSRYNQRKHVGSRLDKTDKTEMGSIVAKADHGYDMRDNADR